MRSPTPRPGELPSVERLSTRIRACCLHRGWDEAQLAQRAGVSRTTLYHLHRGNIRRPRIGTLNRLAAAFEMPLQQFLWGELDLSSRNSGDAGDQEPGRFDRATNRVIQDVFAGQPRLFSGWSERDWEQLYSTFGVGGALNEQGVVHEATRINEIRETRRRLNVVLETHLRDVATQLVESLYRMIVPEGNLVTTAELEDLMATGDRGRLEDQEEPDRLKSGESGSLMFGGE